MVAQGEAQAEGQAQPWERDAKRTGAPEGRQNHTGFCRPSGQRREGFPLSLQ